MMTDCEGFSALNWFVRVADVEQQARQYNVLENAEFIAISAKR
jgi:hypothetical protein